MNKFLCIAMSLLLVSIFSIGCAQQPCSDGLAAAYAAAFVKHSKIGAGDVKELKRSGPVALNDMKRFREDFRKEDGCKLGDKTFSVASLSQEIATLEAALEEAKKTPVDDNKGPFGPKGFGDLPDFKFDF